MVSQFIAYLYELQYSPSTIASHLSAVSFFHKLQGFSDPCHTFIVQRVLLGCKKSASTVDVRRPILLCHLHKIVKACKHLLAQYESYLVAAIFLIAFHGFFRMGELIGHNRKLAKKVVQYTCSDVFKENHTLKIILRYYKTRRSHRPTHVSISKENSKFCPMRALNRYLRVRGQHSGPLFLLADGKPITSRVFNRYFRQVLNWLGLSPRYDKPHSFRIGSCTEAIMRGVPQETVMMMGRWSSKVAFRRYIRLGS